MLSSATGLGVKETMKAEMIEVHVHANTEDVYVVPVFHIYILHKGMQESKLNKKADQRRVRRSYPFSFYKVIGIHVSFTGLFGIHSFRFSLHFVSVFISYQLSLHVRLHAERYRACQIT